MKDKAIRASLFDRMRADLVGPLEANEVLDDRPTDRYLTGILFPQRSEFPDEEDEQLGAGDEGTEEAGGSAAESVKLSNVMRHATAGLSFAIKGNADELPAISPRVQCGTYSPFWTDKNGERSDKRGRIREAKWDRAAHDIRLPAIQLQLGMMEPLSLKPYGLEGLELHLQVARSGDCYTVTAVLLNCHMWTAGDRLENEQKCFFQVELRIEPAEGSTLVARPSRRSGEDEDARLIYRSSREYAVGHTCSAGWQTEDDGSVPAVWTDWTPHREVPPVSPQGDACFDAVRNHAEYRSLSAEWLASASSEELCEGLSLLPDTYAGWIDKQEAAIATLPPDLQPQAKVHIDTCRRACRRMKSSISYLGSSPEARIAFQFANRAMAIQRRWAQKETDLQWRPFQLGFQLLTLESVAQREHPDRLSMDLLWFPTGGGKTEAYLGLVAFVLFLRRLTDEPARGAGVGIIMRYTLRLLTIQQFQRAATLICACEFLRRGNEQPVVEPIDFGETPFSIGLWVGSQATPNTAKEAERCLPNDDDPTPRQLLICPACRQETLVWECGYRRKRGGGSVPEKILIRCENSSCPLGGDPDRQLPVWTVDEDIYREKPSLLIGTVDKFAQIVRKPGQTGAFFGEHCDPPDLIIQDELHLVSGPLGTIAGLYETAIDELCSRRAPSKSGILEEIRPKVIGSTATIRRAGEQVRSLFNRSNFQFPPPVLDAANSCFAKQDKGKPGRLYAGITSAGRSPKFALQAVSGSLLQAADDPKIRPDEKKDPWWTLIQYFNSLRELGGALVMMHDDVPASIGLYSRIRSETPRELEQVDELTSRKRQIELRDILKALETSYGQPGAYDATLATNMISVGVDVPRLSLMIVNGQPKQVAEYIQATSRVGRRFPGLVVTVYNHGKARDRSHYETFSTWHAALYRDVEASSVTPFASRAQDKALHAVLVALVRDTITKLRERPLLTTDLRTEIERTVVPLIRQRAQSVDADELQNLRRKLTLLLDEWEVRASRWSAAGLNPSYWWDQKPERSLMMSAEEYVTRVAAGLPASDVWPTPNSMRNVEPSTPFRLIDGRLRT